MEDYQALSTHHSTTCQNQLIMKATQSMRIWFAIMATLIWIGIFLTGFSITNWLVYLPAVGFTFASISGICPTQIGVTKLLGNK